MNDLARLDHAGKANFSVTSTLHCCDKPLRAGTSRAFIPNRFKELSNIGGPSARPAESLPELLEHLSEQRL